MTLTLRIEYSDGSTTDLPADTLSVTRALDAQDRAEMQLPRDDWTSAEPSTPRTAKLYALVNGSREFGGRLDDVQTNDGTATVRINSPEIDAAEAEPTGENVVYQNVGDDAIVTDQVQAVPTLSTGTITQQASAISYSVSHGSRSKVLYDLRKATGSEFRYNADWTVDYVDRLGSDKSGSVTLGPDEGNIGSDFSKKQDVRENVTHVKALGAQQGPDQITATAAAPSYTSGRKIWKRYENKEVIEQSRLQSIADELVAEYDGEPRALTVECEVYPTQIDADLQLGDSVFVDYPEEDINRALRITDIMFEWTGRGFLALLTLSNRVLTDEGRETKRNDDLQRFNRGYQGFVDRNQTTSGWNPAGDTVPQTLEIPNWPDDIVREDLVECTVQGRAWRSPVKAEPHTHPLNQSAVQSGSPSQVGAFGSANTWNNTGFFDGVSFDDDGTQLVAYFTAHLSDSAGNGNYGTKNPINLRVKNETTGEIYPENGSLRHYYYGGDEYESPRLQSQIAVDENPNGNDYSLEFNPDEDISTSGDVLYIIWGGWYVIDITPSDTVGLSPTIVDTFDGNQYYPTDVEIDVNGTTVMTIAGDSTTDWQQTIDLAGELSAGANTITAEPTGQRGSLNLILSSELFRRGPTS